MYDLMNTCDLLSGPVEGQDSWKKDYQAQEASAKALYRDKEKKIFSDN